MNVPESARRQLFDCILPTYILNDAWQIVAMNEAFRCLAGDELGCRINTSVYVIIDALDNRHEVTERAQRLFVEAKEPPSVDHEYCRLISKRYGTVDLQKLGVRIPGDDGTTGFWIIQLNILDATNRQQLFDDMTVAIQRHRRAAIWR